MSIKYNGKLIAGKYKTQIVTDATESNKGLIRIATQEEINAGTDNTTAVTPKGLATKQNKLTAGTGIEILPDGTINNTQTSAEWGNIQGDIINQSDLIDKFDKKQDVISDLVTIREGASKGATALQSIPAEYITETELNAKGYLTEHQDISGKQDKITSTNKLSADLIADGTTNKVVTATEKAAWSAKQDTISDLVTIREGASKGATALQSYTETDPIYTADKHKIATKQELTTGLSEKQDKLTAGKNIKISSENVISATIDLTYDEKNCRMVFGG